MPRWAKRKPSGPGWPSPAYRSLAMATTRRPPMVARAVRRVGSVPVPSSVHDVVAAAATWIPVGLPMRRAAMTSRQASVDSVALGAEAGAERAEVDGGYAVKGTALRPRAPSTHTARASGSASESTRWAARADSAVCDRPSGSAPVVWASTRGPAKPMVAPASTTARSVSEPYEANMPPVVGERWTAIESRPAAECRPAAAAVRANCTSANMPSCIRAPPDRVTTTTGSRSAIARSNARTTFSPWTRPIDPPITSKSPSMSTNPSARPVRTDS